MNESGAGIFSKVKRLCDGDVMGRFAEGQVDMRICKPDTKYEEWCLLGCYAAWLL
jgi:hypothetical protein